MANIFLKVPSSGANLGSFLFLFIFTHNCSALDQSATAPPLLDGKAYSTRLKATKL